MAWILGLAGSSFIAAVAYRKQALSLSGAVATIAVGTILFALGNLMMFGLMILFFVSSTILTKWKRNKKRNAEQKYEKTGTRDAGQVIANGGAATLIAIFYAAYPDFTWLPAAYIGVLATVTADTWATEIGGLSRSQPRSILTWKPVAKGTSGGVSNLGWLAAAAGSTFIGISVCLLSVLQLFATDLLSLYRELLSGDLSVIKEALFYSVELLWVIPAATVAGWLGANVDSILGATIQAIYRCPVCGEEVEASRHCQQQTTPLRGWNKMNNDAVNLVSSLSGGAVMILLVVLQTIF